MGRRGLPSRRRPRRERAGDTTWGVPSLRRARWRVKTDTRPIRPKMSKTVTGRFVRVLLPHLRNMTPVLISAALLGWVLYQVSPSELRDAFLRLNWPVLVPATVVMVGSLYLWDTVCLQALFTTRGRVPPYGRMLRVRGTAYLVGVVNYGLGQGMVAWAMARYQATSLLAALARPVILAYHDLLVLFSLGLLGSLLAGNHELIVVRWTCSVGLVGLGAIALVLRLLPPKQKGRLKQTRFGAWLDDWSWGHSIRLALLRGIYFAILMVYAGVGLEVCGVNVDLMVVVSTIPLVLVADALPSVSGLGVRERTLTALLHPPGELQAALVALSLLWSTGMIVGRTLIGLGNLWVARLWEKTA